MGIEPTTSGWKPDMFPLALQPQTVFKADTMEDLHLRSTSAKVRLVVAATKHTPTNGGANFKYSRNIYASEQVVACFLWTF